MTTYDYWINIHVNGALPDFSMLDLLNTNTCFAGDTLISMPEGEKPIRDMEEGDEVLTYDPESGENVRATVVKVFRHGAEEGGNYHLLINGLLRVTPNHPLYRCGEWVEAGDLRIGDMIKTFGGETAVISIRKIYKRIPTYNLEVDHPAHNYYAGRILVHNKEAKAGGGPVYAGTPYVVGERGPEVFTPQTNGTITPNEGMQFNNFYGPVTLTVSEESIGDLMGVQ